MVQREVRGVNNLGGKLEGEKKREKAGSIWRKGRNALKKSRNASFPSVPLLEQCQDGWVCRNPTQHFCKHHYQTPTLAAEWTGQQQGKILICHVVVCERTWHNGVFFTRITKSAKKTLQSEKHVEGWFCANLQEFIATLWPDLKVKYCVSNWESLRKTNII